MDAAISRDAALCELQTVRAGIVDSRTEWKNRLGSGLGDSTATGGGHDDRAFHRQLEAVDRAIGETIDQDDELRGRRDLLLSVIGVGETLAASLLVEMPEPGVLRRSGELVAYAGSIRATTDPARQSTAQRAFPRLAMPLCGRHSTCQRCRQCASIPPSQLLSPA